ncbi:MAG: hypothetical protein RIQ53_4166 [Pseudomonadota bacterium]|jgi:hypothetical protein
MTIRLLTDYPFGRYTIPAGSIVSVFDSVTEAALIASRQAAASAAAVTWTVPVEVPDRSSPAVTGGAIASALQRASSDDLRTIRSAVAGDWNPAVEPATAGLWSAAALAAGAVATWASLVADGTTMAQATAASQPVAGVAGVALDGSDDHLIRSYPGARLVRAVTLPDGASKAEPGQGWTCTGMGADPDDGTYWICNHGRRTELLDTAQQAPSVVQISIASDGAITILREILLEPLGWTGSSTQGVGVTPTTLWVNHTLNGTYIEINKSTGALTGRVITPSWAGSGCSYDAARDALWCGQNFGTGSGLELRLCSDGSLVAGSQITTGLNEQDSLSYYGPTRTLLISFGPTGSPGNVRAYDCTTTTPVSLGSIVLTEEAGAVEGICWDGGTQLLVMSDGYYHQGLAGGNRCLTYQIAPLVSDVVDIYGVWSLDAATSTDAVLAVGDPVQSAKIGFALMTTGRTNLSVWGQTGESAATSRVSYSATVPSMARPRIVYARLDRTAQLISLWIDGTLIGTQAATTWTRPFANAGTAYIGRAADAGRNLDGTIQRLGYSMGALDHQRIEGWLAHECGLQAQLPLTHPWRGRRPD